MAYQRVSETLNLTRALDLATLTTVKGPKGGRQDKPKRYFPRRLSNLTVEMSSRVAFRKCERAPLGNEQH